MNRGMGGRERAREGKRQSCQERGICDRSRAVPNAGVKAWGLGEFLPPDPMCLLRVPQLQSHKLQYSEQLRSRTHFDV